MAAAARLYFDYKKNKPKFGAMPRNKPGTLYRFIDVIQQLDLNYDLYSMSGDEIMDLLDELNRELKVTVIVVTHEKEIAKRTRRQIYIKDGALVKKYL